jgi:hypothetical protein
MARSDFAGANMRALTRRVPASVLPLMMLCASLLSGNSIAHPLTNAEIWLASSHECNTCGIYAELARRHHYESELTFDLGTELARLPIRSVDKASLSRAILDQMPGNEGPAGRHWRIQLTVIIVQLGKVLAFGNIADSVDLRTTGYPAAMMYPPAHPAGDDPSLQESTDYAAFFLDHWNLEYFLKVALGRRPANNTSHLVDLNAVRAASLSRSNVVLWGAAETPIKNAAFIAHRIADIRTAFEGRSRIHGLRVITLYGRGPTGTSNDTSVLSNGEISFMHPDIPIDYAADLRGIDATLGGIRQSGGAHTLLIHVGHSGLAGIPIWGLLGTVTPDDISSVGGNDTSKLVMVSGGCHSGIFARSVQCGFFAAHPEVTATGCQLSQDAIDQSDDYLKLFFEALGESTRRANVGLDEAHWYASTRIEDHQISYTTVDALADAYFAESPEKLPATMSVAAIRKLRSAGTTPEGAALDKLTAGLSDSVVVGLDDLIARNYEAEKKLEKAREISSRSRNEISHLPYKLMLPMLTRRLIYRSANASDPELARTTKCEAQSLLQVLN